MNQQSKEKLLSTSRMEREADEGKDETAQVASDYVVKQVRNSQVY